MAAQIASKLSNAEGIVRKPELVSKIEGCNSKLNDALFIPGEDGIITASEDRSVQIWLKRDNGQYWPSICHVMSDAATCLHYSKDSRKLFVGLNNGNIVEFNVEEDFNTITQVRMYVAHLLQITAIVYSNAKDWLLSCSKDKTLQLHCSQTGMRIREHKLSAWCSSLRYDEISKYAFVGDFAGEISILKLTETAFEIITVLKGHSGSISSMAWDSSRSLLFSGSFDQSVIVWDIGGQKGTAYELQGHSGKVKAVYYNEDSKQLISTGDDAKVVFWDMSVKRLETPTWLEEDLCRECKIPFFWNFKTMWQTKTIGSRQHHCRLCGNAVCATCSNHISTIPIMGYELPVRICISCYPQISDKSRTPMAQFHEVKHCVELLDIDSKRMLTIGNDRIIKIWNISTVLN